VLSHGVVCVILRLRILVQHWLVQTNGQTDRQTDGLQHTAHALYSVVRQKCIKVLQNRHFSRQTSRIF